MLLNPVKTGVCPLGIRPRCVFSKMSSFLCASHPTDNNPWKYKRYSRSSRNCKVAKHNCNICQCCTTLPKRPTSSNLRTYLSSFIAAPYCMCPRGYLYVQVVLGLFWGHFNDVPEGRFGLYLFLVLRPPPENVPDSGTRR